MEEGQEACPFKTGDRVVFAPNEHAYGWTWLSFASMRVKPGDTGTVTRILENQHI